MTFHVPREDANLIEVERQSVVRLGKDGQILRNLLVAVAHLVEHKVGNDALAFGVLRHVQGHIKIDHAGQHPSHAIVDITHQPPVLDNRLGLFLLVGLCGGLRWSSNCARSLGGAAPQERDLLSLGQLI